MHMSQGRAPSPPLLPPATIAPYFIVGGYSGNFAVATRFVVTVMAPPRVEPQTPLAEPLPHPFFHERLANQDGVHTVDLKDLNCGAADRREPDQARAVPGEMLVPGIAPWVKQSRHPARNRVEASEIGPLGSRDVALGT